MILTPVQAGRIHSSSVAAVAQWIEYWPPKPRVVGSIPASRTIKHIPQMSPARAGQASAQAAAFFLMNLDLYIDMAAYLLLRAASYALLNLGEDAALIALMFC